MRAGDRKYSILIVEDDADINRLLKTILQKNGYYGEDNTVNVHVSNIRKKLAKADHEEEYIQTVWGIGFKMKQV